MSKELLLPIVGKLNSMVINHINFENKHDGIQEFSETSVRISTNYTIGLKDTYDEYMISINLHVEGSEKDTGEETFVASCSYTGFYKSDESLKDFFDEYGEEVVEIFRMRGMYQLYSIARMEVQGLLRKAGIMIKDFIFEQDDITNAFVEVLVPAKKAKKKAKKKLKKKSTSK